MMWTKASIGPLLLGPGPYLPATSQVVSASGHVFPDQISGSSMWIPLTESGECFQTEAH